MDDPVSRHSVELLTAQLADLRHFRALVAAETAMTDAEVDGLGPFLNETDDLADALVHRHEHLAAAGICRSEEDSAVQCLRQSVATETDRVRKEIVRFAANLTARQVAAATALEEPPEAVHRHRRPSGGGSRPRMANGIG